jgi:hypothetical protein
MKHFRELDEANRSHFSCTQLVAPLIVTAFCFAVLVNSAVDAVLVSCWPHRGPNFSWIAAAKARGVSLNALVLASLGVGVSRPFERATPAETNFRALL